MTKNEQYEAKMALKELIDRYATESDKNNQDYYNNVFSQNCKVQVYIDKEIAMDFKNLQDLIVAFKDFGKAKESFHINGQQVIDFQDKNHASGIVYAMAHLVNEVDGKNMLVTHYIRYYDKYEKFGENWLIVERKQYFLFSKTEEI